MKIRTLLLGVLMILPTAILLADWNPGNYVPKPHEFSNETWVNDKSGNPYHIQKETIEWHWEAEIPYREWKEFFDVSDTVPFYSGTDDHIDSTWRDSEGNVWFKVYGTITGGAGVGMKYQTFIRESKDGTVRESVERYPPEFDSKFWPTQIDPKDFAYYIFYRAEK